MRGPEYSMYEGGGAFEPCVVYLEGEHVEISDDEKALLELGPKFCVKDGLKNCLLVKLRSVL